MTEIELEGRIGSMELYVVPDGPIPGGLLLSRDFLDFCSIALCIRGYNFKLDSLDYHDLFADNIHNSE